MAAVGGGKVLSRCHLRAREASNQPTHPTLQDALDDQAVEADEGEALLTAAKQAASQAKSAAAKAQTDVSQARGEARDLAAQLAAVKQQLAVAETAAAQALAAQAAAEESAERAGVELQLRAVEFDNAHSELQAAAAAAEMRAEAAGGDAAALAARVAAAEEARGAAEAAMAAVERALEQALDDARVSSWRELCFWGVELEIDSGCQKDEEVHDKEVHSEPTHLPIQLITQTTGGACSSRRQPRAHGDGASSGRRLAPGERAPRAQLQRGPPIRSRQSARRFGGRAVAAPAAAGGCSGGCVRSAGRCSEMARGGGSSGGSCPAAAC